jgi:hypothetical protein
MGNRLVRWFTFTVGFALLPLTVSILLNYLRGSEILATLQRSPELLFFCLMVCATALGDITESSVAVGRDIVLRILSSALLLGAVVSAILYGSFLNEQMAVAGSAAFQRRLFTLAALMSLLFLGLGTVVQVLLARIEEQP